jgi:plasmid stability protein
VLPATSCQRTKLGRSASVASSDSIDIMATITIRQFDEKTKTQLRVRAAHHGRSMEEEAREILRSALTASSPVKGNLAETVRRRFAAFGGLGFDLPRRDAMRHVPEFGE